MVAMLSAPSYYALAFIGFTCQQTAYVLAFTPSAETAHITPDHENLHRHHHNRRTFVESIIATSAALPVLSSSFALSTANAISPEEASKTYDTYASTYDNLDGGSLASSLGIDDARQTLLSQASGNVLEIGVGTGLNLDSYNYKNIKSLTCVDISEGMLSQAKIRINQLKGATAANTDIKFVKADATSELIKLFGDEAFDTVVDTFSLCVMGNDGAKQCLHQMTGVVKKDTGSILLIENTRANNPLLGYYQDVTASTAADVGGKGCLYNQNVGEMIQQTDRLELMREEAFAGGLFRSFTCRKI